MSNTDQLVQSGTRLQRQGLLFLQQTLLAGQTFVSETRTATTTFGGDLSSAGTKLAKTTRRSVTGFGRACRKEGLNWRDLLLKTQDAYVEALKAQMDELEGGANAALEVLRPDAVQTRVLQTAHDLLDGAQSFVDGRLVQATETKKAAPRVAPKKKAKAAAPTADRAPIRNYEQLTAKDVVARIQRLSEQQATALLDYEQARKNRSTVIRAAKQRLAAS